MGVPFDSTTTTIANVTNGCLLQILPFLVTLQYSLVIFPTNSLFGRLLYFHPLLFILGPKNLFIFTVLTLALMIDKTSSHEFHRP